MVVKGSTWPGVSELRKKKKKKKKKKKRGKKIVVVSNTAKSINHAIPV